MLYDILHSPDPEQSDLSLGVYLCNKNGAELKGLDRNGNTVSKGLIGVAKLCLKDLVREEGKGDGATVEISGMLSVDGILGLPPKEDPKAKKKAKPKVHPTSYI